MQRSLKSKFFPGAFVFPGGAVEQEDAIPTPLPQAGEGAQRVRVGGSSVDMETFKRAAVRECAEEVGLTLDLASLHPWARWITPEGEGRRYDTVFFVAPLPSGEVKLQRAEAEQFVFASPSEVLAKFASGEMALAPPTVVVVAELAASASPFAETREPLGDIQPLRTAVDGRLMLLLPGDPLHPKAPPRPWPAGVSTRILLADWPKWSFATG